MKRTSCDSAATWKALPSKPGRLLPEMAYTPMTRSGRPEERYRVLAMQRPKRSREISDQVEMMERRTTRATPAPPRGANPSSGGPWQMAVNPASEKPSRRRGASCELENPISETQPRSAPNCVREEPYHLPTKRASVPVRPACRAATRRTLLPLHVMSSPIHCA